MYKPRQQNIRGAGPIAPNIYVHAGVHSRLMCESCNNA